MPTYSLHTKKGRDVLRRLLRGAAANPLPEPRSVNREGIELPERIMRKARRGVAQINRGEYLEFDSAQQACDYLFRRRK